MKKIKLTQGKYAIVDDEDYEFISRLKPIVFNRNENKSNNKLWEVILDGAGRGGTYYVKHLLLKPKQGNMVVEAKNGNNLDLRKDNLWIVPRELSLHHNKKKENATSKYKGVCFNKRVGKWEAYCHRGLESRKSKYIGIFNTEKEAGLAYNEKAKELYGESAYQNVIK